MKKEFIGKIRYDGSYLFKFTLDKAVKFVCEHCGKLSRKVIYLETSLEDPQNYDDGCPWCRECGLTFDTHPETPKKKFTVGQKVFFWGGFHGKTKVIGKFLGAFSDDDGIVQVKLDNGGTSTLKLDFDDLYPVE